MLPFIEHFFGVLTDLSLLEFGDVAHPLLQELVRRAPSTYNHSITVGSIAEAAAESIHARGLLVRVGAYFHDIGKMLKPDYFVENQGPDDNRHEALAPAMSTLVIIAHIKDGADLARQHRLPQPIIDLIAQHHGTTRVEFFYDRATEQQQADPNGGEVDESSYRYPGPKPQTKEAAVLMLADAVESASRTLVDPTPARIESLVREIAEHRLHGGQFDESGLTLRELRTIEKSMVMSLTSIYHGRIKYPEQRTRIAVSRQAFCSRNTASGCRPPQRLRRQTHLIVIHHHQPSEDAANRPAAHRGKSVQAIVRDAGIAKRTISVAMVDDATIAKLHRQFLDDPEPTDVLSFVLERSDQSLEGEVVVMPTRRRLVPRGTIHRRECSRHAASGRLR